MLKKCFISLLAFAAVPVCAEIDLRGSLGLETRYYLDAEELQSSIFMEPEWYWENGASAVTLKPFARVDSLDSERTHADLREAFYQYVGRGWELRAGVNKIFWGVTESQHLIDVINQTDYLEGFDGEDKLGQPMLQLTGINAWGIVDAFIMPYFREREFPGKYGHFNYSHSLATASGPVFLNAVFADAQYESSREEQHWDTAVRYSHNLGSFDIGLSYFSGTRRDPSLQVTALNPLEKTIAFQPYYGLMEQWGLDVQATLGSWLWKLEALSRNQEAEDYTAAVAGFEYTFYGVSDRGSDLGLLLEFNWDERGKTATTPLQNDLFVGGRYTWNDEQSSEFLLGLVQDLDNSHSYMAKLEASRRLGDSYRISLDAWAFNSDNSSDLLYVIRTEDFIQLTLEKFF